MRNTLLLSILLFISSSVFAAGGEYPAKERRLFMEGCVNGNAMMRDLCVCVLAKFQEKMTFEEFKAMDKLTDEQLRKHRPYASSIIECANAGS